MLCLKPLKLCSPIDGLSLISLLSSGAITLSSAGDVTLKPATNRALYITVGSTAVLAADASTGDVTIDTSDLGATTTVKGDTAEITSTSHTIISSGDTATGEAGDITVSQLFYGLSETRLLVDDDGAMYANPEIDLGYNLFKTSSSVADTANALYTIAGSNNANGLTVSSGTKRNVVDITLDNYRGCYVEVLMEIVFSDAVIIWQGEYLLHYSGTSAQLMSNTAMTNAYTTAGATLSNSVTFSGGTFTIAVTYTQASGTQSTGAGYSMVEIKGGYKSYAIYNT